MNAIVHSPSGQAEEAVFAANRAWELDRVAIFGLIDGRWFMAICIVDGDGRAHGMTGRRSFGSRREAEIACSSAR